MKYSAPGNAKGSFDYCCGNFKTIMKQEVGLHITCDEEDERRLSCQCLPFCSKLFRGRTLKCVRLLNELHKYHALNGKGEMDPARTTESSLYSQKTTQN